MDCPNSLAGDDPLSSPYCKAYGCGVLLKDVKIVDGFEFVEGELISSDSLS